MTRIGLLFIAIICVIPISAKNGDDANFEFTHNRAAISGMLTSSGSWQLELSYHYMFNNHIGIGGAIGSWKVWYVEGWAAGNDWQIDSDDESPWNLYLRPSLVLKSPAVRVGSIDMGLYAEPGVMLNIPYSRVWIHQTTNWPEYEWKSVSTGSGQWFAIDLRVGVYVNTGPLGIGAGYMMSNMDVYSQYRHMSYRGHAFKFYPTKSFMQGAYLTLSYYF